MIEKLDVEQLATLMGNTNSWWAWSIADGKHWITNRHIAIVVNQEGLDDCEGGREFLDCLEHNFEKRTPEEGKTLILNCGAVSESELKLVESLKNMFTSKMSTNPGMITPLIHADGLTRKRWIKFKGFNLFVQDQYISLIWDATNEKAYADFTDKPLFLCDGHFIILPFRNADQKEVITELKEFETFLESLGV